MVQESGTSKDEVRWRSNNSTRVIPNRSRDYVRCYANPAAVVQQREAVPPSCLMIWKSTAPALGVQKERQMRT
jgi:hypothetical protein